MVSLRASWRWGVLHCSFTFFQMLLSVASEFTPQAAGGIILNGGRCDPMNMCNHVMLQRTDEEGRWLESSSLLEQTSYGRLLVQMVVKPSRLMVIGQDCKELLKSASPHGRLWILIPWSSLWSWSAYSLISGLAVPEQIVWQEVKVKSLR